MPSTTGPAKALGAIFVVGAILMAFVAWSLMFAQPVKIGTGAGLYAVLGALLGLIVTGLIALEWHAWGKRLPPTGTFCATESGSL